MLVAARLADAYSCGFDKSSARDFIEMSTSIPFLNFVNVFRIVMKVIKAAELEYALVGRLEAGAVHIDRTPRICTWNGPLARLLYTITNHQLFN